MMKYWCVFSMAALLFAQDAERFSVPLSDSTRPATVYVEVSNGDLTVRAYEGREVVVEPGGKMSGRRRPSRNEPDREGLRRLDMGDVGVEVEEQGNVVRIKPGPRNSNGDLTVQVPATSSLKLKTLSGTVTVDGVGGEIEASSLNGQVRIVNTSGSVVAHSLNGNVIVKLSKVGEKPMAFSTMNGDIDVTMPTDTKAKIRIKNDHGEVWSDFEVKLDPTSRTEGGRGPDGRLKVKFERTMTGTINGGGVDMSFTTLNGQVRIRKAK